jgi:hypothetical protein
MTPAGFPHSEIPGSVPACGSPRLIAACHVLHRLSAPRHPPCTLRSLTKLECLYSANPVDSHFLAFLPDSVVKDPRIMRSAPASARSALTAAHPTSRCRSRRGGADRVRTDDLRLARAALSQLSYSPEPLYNNPEGREIPACLVVGLGRFELPTSRLSGVRSDQLSYRPEKGTVRRFPGN